MRRAQFKKNSPRVSGRNLFSCPQVTAQEGFTIHWSMDTAAGTITFQVRGGGGKAQKSAETRP